MAVRDARLNEPITCEECGERPSSKGRAGRYLTRCLSCRRASAEPCPLCDGRKSRGATLCGSCERAARGGARSSSWKGGRFEKSNGYVYVWAPDHPNSQADGYIFEHRLMMATHLGRPLADNENVHHRNRVKNDNRLDNLELWNTTQPAGARPEDLVEYAEEILEKYSSFQLPAPRAQLKRVGVDLDGTLATSVWTPATPGREIGAPIWENVEKVNDLVAAGWKIWIYTARPDTDYEAIETWLTYWGIPFHGILTGKPLLVALFDDRVYNASEEDWLSIIGRAPRV